MQLTQIRDGDDVITAQDSMRDTPPAAAAAAVWGLRLRVSPTIVH